MVPFDNYQLFEAERCMTVAEARAVDDRRGLFAAAISRSFRARGAQLRDRLQSAMDR
jgi:hypothetical protein